MPQLVDNMKIIVLNGIYFNPDSHWEKNNRFNSDKYLKRYAPCSNRWRQM